MNEAAGRGEVHSSPLVTIEFACDCIRLGSISTRRKACIPLSKVVTLVFYTKQKLQSKGLPSKLKRLGVSRVLPRLVQTRNEIRAYVRVRQCLGLQFRRLNERPRIGGWGGERSEVCNLGRFVQENEAAERR